jgi:hypothetical protein
MQKVHSEGSPQRLDTLGVWSYKKRRRAIIGEEMRILYVSMTVRAIILSLPQRPRSRIADSEEPEKLKKRKKI